ncbi:hypothetical protein MCOR12_010959 [Pyricularia oryzae]|nr:hypothetical protein MCOR12_010959 [Pyricularia oryzae]
MAHIMQILEETGAFGVLGPVNAQHKLTVQWPNSPPFEPGQSVPGHLLNSARSQPKVFTDFQGGGNGYLLVMLAHYSGQSTDNQMCHWIVSGVPVSDNSVEVEKGHTLAPYIPPMMGDEGQAQLFFLLLNPRPGAAFNPVAVMSELRGMMPMGPPKLNTRSFLKNTGLEVVAASVLMG